MASCVFCKVINKEIKSTVVKENDHILVIKDIAPKAPIHYLIIPKKHIENLLQVTEADKDICWNMLDMVKTISKEQSIETFNIIINNGIGAGQSVFHLHWHLLAGKNIYTSGLSL
jgi:histidine triad (HIT) family protein